MKLQNSFRDYTAESALFVRRALVAFLGILLLTGVLIANLYNLQIVRFTDYQTRSNENRIKLVPIAPSRGIIYDRNGIPLALNRTIYQIEMMPEKVDNVQQTLDALRSVVDLTDDDIAAFRKERARSHRFTSIPVKTNLTEVQVARFAVNQYRFPGVEVKGYKRRYDIPGKPWDTPQLAAELERWKLDGRDVSLLIGGPEGLSPACKAAAEQSWSLSALTLPHPLVRVLVAESLYRAWSITTNHPYHRE